VLLLVHGLCLSDQQWRRNEAEGLTGHGEVLADALGYTPVYLRYNSGLHTSTNGRELSEQLSGLLSDWPVPVEELSVVAHSMGGLVVRSAADHALKLDRAWLKQLQNLVFLGTPHHGAPLERIGHWLHLALDKMPYTRPFTRLGRLRSAGITDLRFGHVQDEDWQGLDPHEKRPDSRQPVPLPEEVTCYTIAATLAEERGLLADRLLGDGLVPLYSALGHHDEDHHALGFSPVAQRIFYSMGHLELLHKTRVSDQLLHWLAPESSST
jgi:pimeloyl-ACP methyl ester carboxylesterase